MPPVINAILLVFVLLIFKKTKVDCYAGAADARNKPIAAKFKQSMSDMILEKPGCSF